jgi:protein tyrosine phosphatase (PTP) superfamily phosphohydrolase (DUF442 family)
MGVEGSYNFHRVSTRTTTSGVVGVERLGQLGSEGYDTVINLLPDSSEYAIAGEADIVGEQGLNYIYIPVDFAAPTGADRGAFSAEMSAHGGKMIHVHCAANFRVSAFYGLYAVATGLQCTSDADDLMRLCWDPADHPVWATFITEQRALIGRQSR